MNVQITAVFDGVPWRVDLERPTVLAIPQTFDEHQPNHFGAPYASAMAFEAGDFVGDVARGGSCNVASVTTVPHCNGTHTETISHIIRQMFPVGEVAGRGPLTALLVTVAPAKVSETPAVADTYVPPLDPDDEVISIEAISHAIRNTRVSVDGVQALVVRSRPNSVGKKDRKYGDGNVPPFFTSQAMQYIVNNGFDHLLVDFPSVDRMYDEGKMSNHCLFWEVDREDREMQNRQASVRTITEMIFVPDDLNDGPGVLDLQVPRWHADAAPSRPVWYPLVPLQKEQED